MGQNLLLQRFLQDGSQRRGGSNSLIHLFKPNPKVILSKPLFEVEK